MVAASAYPNTLVIPPLALPHKQTFILLHGRGSSGDKFGPALLETPVPLPSSSETSTSFQQLFPHARFVFPTAARRRATVYGRAYTHQWFNNWKLDPPATEREELQVPGLKETTAYLHGLVRTEIEALGGRAGDVVLGGLSQGCAASLVAMLLWEGERLGCFVGMCGWLPFAKRLNDVVNGGGDANGGEEADDFDPFERDENGDEATLDPLTKGAMWLRDELGILPATDSSSPPRAPGDISVFLGHGVEDDRVSVVLGRQASSCLSKLDIETSWREYNGLGHWYSGDMLRDMVQFIHAKTEWDTSDVSGP
jgi:predicted esterase